MTDATLTVLPGTTRRERVRRRRPHLPKGGAATVGGLVLLVPIGLAAIFQPWLPLPDPTTPAPLESLSAPSWEHPLGTDKIGRDILSRTIAGARISLLVGLASSTIAVAVGVVVGTISGFFGRRVDGLLMAVTNVMLSFPSLLLAIAVVAVAGAGVWQVIFAVSMANAPRAIRMQRSLVLSLKTRPYMDAGRLAAAPWWWLLVRHVVPNTIAPMVVVASIYAAVAIVVESSLSFLGLGIVPPTPSWGNLISDGRPYLREAWWISTFPGIAIVVVSISLHLLADGLRERLSVTP